MSHQHLRARFGSFRCALALAAAAACACTSATRASNNNPYFVSSGMQGEMPSVAHSSSDLLVFRAAGLGGTGMFGLQPSSPPINGGTILTIRGEAFASPELSPPSMSSSGVLAFADFDNGASSLFVRAFGGDILTIRGENFGQFRSSSVGPNGTVYSHVTDSTGRSSLLAFPPGGQHVTIFGTDFSPSGRAAVNSSGDVASRVTGPNGQGLRARAPGGDTITIVGSNRFTGISSPASSGHLWIFGGHELSSGLSGIFAQVPGGDTITIVGEQFLLPQYFTEPAANEAGAIVYGRLAPLNGGLESIEFTDIYGGPRQTLAAIGDELLGSTITELSFNPDGLNEAGEFGYAARLADGTTAIMIASNVPAPGSLMLLGTGAAVYLRRKRREVA